MNEEENETADDPTQMYLSPVMKSNPLEGDLDKSVGCLPIPFERAAKYSWIRPYFDSDVLEGQFQNSAAGYFTKRFRCGLIYLMAVYIVWLIYSAFNLSGWNITIFILLVFFNVSVYYITYRPLYVNFPLTIAIIAAVVVVLGALIFCLTGYSSLSRFTIVIYVILVIYTIFPLPPYASLSISMVFSGCYLIIEYFKADAQFIQYGLFIRFMCLICIQIVGFHVSLMTHARMRGTFMKVGQRLLVRRQLEAEKQIKEKMIYSAMPPTVAGWLLENEKNRETDSTGDISSLFRPFMMRRMTDVSILFADIVGFTRMSSNKTAEQIVEILNELFERFDELCFISGCEKISTLGDCYYCVAGCPEPRTDHAVCCVEMGLGMIDAIQEFDLERGEDVNMRVGIHTGTVLCGVVGTRRFKFDVWSNDVTFANKLESTGWPGRIHISQDTANFLGDKYRLDEYHSAASDLGVKTYLVAELGKKLVRPQVRVAVAPPPPKLDHSISVTSSTKASPKKPHYLSLLNGMKTTFSSLPNMFESLGSNKQALTRKSASIKSQFSYPSQKQQELPQKCELHPLPVTSEELLSLCPSATSRKDSGIKSTSRRSSIMQQPLPVINSDDPTLQQRVSGYFTTSRSSLPHSDTSSAHYADAATTTIVPSPSQLRKQSDLQLIRCIKDIAQHASRVPLRRWTLCFASKQLESDYRKHAHVLAGSSAEREQSRAHTIMYSPRFNTFLEAVVSEIILICTIIGVQILTPSSTYLIVLTTLTVIIQTTILTISYLILSDKFSNKHQTIPRILSNWYSWHVIACLLLSLPVILTLTFNYSTLTKSAFHNFQFPLLPYIDIPYYYYTFILLTCVSHFCNFTQLNFLVKTFLSTICVLPALILTLIHPVSDPYAGIVALGKFLSDNNVTSLNGSNYVIGQLFVNAYPNISLKHFDTTENGRLFIEYLKDIPDSDQLVRNISESIYFNWPETFLSILTIVFLIVLLNRESEVNYRSSFYFNAESNRDKIKVLNMKLQADLLYENIIPKYVGNILKFRFRYCQNHDDVGIIFANIVNFNKLYEETYYGGKEYLRYLNELIADFDELLDRFKNVEKIKTIGSTFMAASGLNQEVRKLNENPYDHIYELMEFAKEMYKVIENFNNDLLGFKLVLRVGFNIGEVTAGVIGCSKLLYDIWGDTVNVASRMDSTGIEGRIQLPNSCLKYFTDSQYKFEPRGSVYVKGKGDILCYLLKQ